MNDREVILTGAVLGALAGMAAAFGWFTPAGRRWRADAERSVSVMLQDAERLVSAADQVRQSVTELRGKSGWPRRA